MLILWDLGSAKIFRGDFYFVIIFCVSDSFKAWWGCDFMRITAYCCFKTILSYPDVGL